MTSLANSSQRLTQKVALVTGAAQGIGFSIAKRLAQSGASVVLLDRDEKALSKASSELKNGKFKIDSLSVDVTSKFEVTRSIEQILSRQKKIDILVNNAGIIRDNFLSKISEEDWDAVLDVNLKGAFLLCQGVFEAMKSQEKGSIVNIASRSWLGNIGQANYAASKGGLVSLTRTLALEFARFGIRVNAVAPGLIDTPMTRGMPEKALERLLKMQPTGKMGQPEDIAAAVEFLASSDAEFITGQILHVDGGKSCGLLSL